MILSTLVTSQLHFEMCAGLYGHPVFKPLFIQIHLVASQPIRMLKRYFSTQYK